MQLFVAALLSTASFSASAICVDAATKPVPFRLESCQDVELSSSPSRTRRAGGRAFLHSQGLEIKGTLIGGRILEGGEEPAIEAESSRRHFLADGQASEICPSLLPMNVEVMEQPRCCDTTPRKGDCISPFPIAVFTLTEHDN
jgi:hypothetical protein